PRAACRNMLVAQHVEQRDLHVDRAPQLGMLDELNTHQQAAVGASLYTEMGRTGNTLGDEVARHGGEVVEDPLAVCLEAGIVPCRSEFASAANVGQRQ